MNLSFGHDDMWKKLMPLICIFLPFVVDHLRIEAQILHPDSTKSSNGKPNIDLNQTQLTAVDLYRRLLRQKRYDQMEAVKQMISIDKFERQYKIVQLLLQKISVVLQENRVKLMELGYTPGDDFPKDDNIKDALSLVIENTAFLGDVLLRLPDITNKLLRMNKEWDLLVKWGVSFVNETGILEERDSKLLNLMAQELQLVDRDPNYVNPYKESTEKVKESKLGDSVKQTTVKDKKKKKEKHRGPRLQGSRNEL